MVNFSLVFCDLLEPANQSLPSDWEGALYMLFSSQLEMSLCVIDDN